MLSQQGQPVEIADLNNVIKVKVVLVIRGQYTDMSTFLSNLHGARYKVCHFPGFSIVFPRLTLSYLTLNYYIQ